MCRIHPLGYLKETTAGRQSVGRMPKIRFRGASSSGGTRGEKKPFGETPPSPPPFRNRSVSFRYIFVKYFPSVFIFLRDHDRDVHISKRDGEEKRRELRIYLFF
ncbi:hypothetical protein P5V15_011003 [Pogonomyrmex californicus]